jgi:hypothetical protein
MNKQISAISLVVILAIATIAITTTNVQAKSNGYNVGKNDRMDGNEYNDTCPDDVSGHLDCITYQAGYVLGWNAESITHGNDTPRDTEPDSSDRDSNSGDDGDN